MPKFHLYASGSLLVILCTVLGLSACSTNKNTPSQNKPGPFQRNYAVETVSETSALVCDGDALWTINDSGNSPNVYQLKPYSSWLQSYETDAVNLDWEALTLHQNKLVIGDIGNNNGQRLKIKLYLLDWPLHVNVLNRANEVELPLHVNQNIVIAPYQHDLDAEALVSSPHGLLLFSKNWLVNNSTVYKIDLVSKQLSNLATINDLPGMVTDATWVPKSEVFILTGYRNPHENGLLFALTGEFAPFLALVDRNFNLLKTLAIENAGQVEGVCVDEKEQVWLSQEASGAYPAQFWQWGPLHHLLK